MKNRSKNILLLLCLAAVALQLVGCMRFEILPDAEEPSITPTASDAEPTAADISEHPLETVTTESSYNEAHFAKADDYGNISLGISKTIKLKTGYKSLLTQEQRTFYDKIVENVFFVSKEVGDNGYHYIKQAVLENCELSEAELRLVITAFSEDNPAVFWNADIFGYTNSGGKTVLQLYSKYSVPEINRMISEISAVALDFASQIPDGLEDYERETMIHDLLIDNCAYAENVTDIDENFNAFGIYGALVEKKAVCEGYSRAFQWLLSLGGIESINIIGSDDEALLHMWNAVKLDDEWYCVDSTWDDCGQYTKYDYYNTTTKEMADSGHNAAKDYQSFSEDEICGTDTAKPVSFNLFDPYCCSDKNSYISKGTVKLTEFSDYTSNEIVQKLYSAIDKEAEFVEIYIDIPDTDYNSAVERLTNSRDGELFDYIDRANKMYSGRHIDRENISVIKKDNKKILTVILNYI